MSEILGLGTVVAGVAVVIELCRRYSYISTVVVVAFGLRLVAAVVHEWVYPLPHGTADAVVFEETAARWAEGGFLEAVSHINPARSYMYSWAAALLYAVTERSRLMLQGLNVIGGTLIVVNAYLIAKSLWGKRRAHTIAWFVALFPFLIQISAVTHREVVIVFFLTLGVYFGIRWVDSGRGTHLVMALVLLGAAVLFHGGLFVAIAVAMACLGALGLWQLVSRLLSGRVRVGALVGLIGLVGVAGTILGTGALKTELSTVGAVAEVDVETVASMAEARAEDEAAYLEHTYPRTIGDMIVQMPLRVFYFLFSPLPWQVDSVYHAIGFVDMSLYVLVFWGLWQSKERILADRRATLVLLVTLATIAAFAAVTSNFGTAIRHRGKFIPLLAALWATPVLQKRLVLWRGTKSSGDQ